MTTTDLKELADTAVAGVFAIAQSFLDMELESGATAEALHSLIPYLDDADASEAYEMARVLDGE